jgi:hypothetical protein
MFEVHTYKFCQITKEVALECPELFLLSHYDSCQPNEMHVSNVTKKNTNLSHFNKKIMVTLLHKSKPLHNLHSKSINFHTTSYAFKDNQSFDVLNMVCLTYEVSCCVRHTCMWRLDDEYSCR